MLDGTRRRHGVRRPLLAALGALAACVSVLLGAASPAGAAVAGVVHTAPATVPGPVVLVGTGGVRWSETGPSTPTLRALGANSAVAVLSARSVRTSTCPVDGWLAVSAGARAADEPGACRSPALVGSPSPGTTAVVDRWDVYRRRAASAPEGARLGLLGDALATASLRSAAVGPGAAVALATSSGRTSAVWPGPQAGAGGSVDPAADPDELARQVRQALATRPALLVVDAGAVRSGAGAAEDDQVRGVDRRVAAVLAALPGTATVLTASLADADEQARLQLVAAHGPAPDGGSFGGYLRSPSTRQDGLVQATDVLPTLLAALGLTTPEVAGSPMTSVDVGTPASVRLSHLSDLATPAETIDPIVAAFFGVLLPLEFVVYVAALMLMYGRRPAPGRPDRARLASATAAVAVAFALVPAATFLANLTPWWRSAAPGAALVGVTVACTIPLAVVALAGPWRRSLAGPAGVAGALTALVLTADVATGSHLSLTALIGGQPLVGGRFYGLSNPGFALFATGTVFAAVAAADPLLIAGRRGAAAAVVASIGVLATLVDGLPGLGSDFGGPPALVPAFAYLALRVAGVRLTWRRVVAVIAGTVAVLVALAVGDWLRPPDRRTHLGQFVQTVIDGGGWDVVIRKLEQNVSVVTSAPVQLALPLIAVAVGVVLARPRRFRLEPLALAYERCPALRPGMAALAVLLVVGFALNDTGAAIPPVAGMVALPLLLSVVLRADAGRSWAAVAGAVRGAGKAPAQHRDDDGREQQRRQVAT
jgi:hypothetical protein